MAIAEMSKVKVIGLKSERSLIMNVLERSGCFEVIPSSLEGLGEKVRDTSQLDYYLTRQARISFAINFLEQINSEAGDAIKSDVKKAKKKKFAGHKIRDYGTAPVKKKNGRAEIGYDDFYDVAAKEYELLNICDILEEISFKRIELKSKSLKLVNFNKNLKPYENVDINFSQFRETKTSVSMLAYNPGAASVPLEDLDVYTESYQSGTGTLVGIVADKELKHKITERLIISGFSVCPYSYADTAKNMMTQNAAEIERNAADDEACIRSALSYTKYLSELKIFYDVLGLEIEKANFELEFVKTNSTFLLEGWTAKEHAGVIVEALKEKTDKLITEISAPAEGDTPPTLIKNNKLFRPFEDTTNMYSVPAYGETDPNPLMAVFFFIFFGIMVGDAGYGLILSISGFIILKLFKLEKGIKNLITVFAVCGISAVIWGILLGGVFSIESVPVIWFNPLQEPIYLLAVSLVLGAVQLCAGYVMNAYGKIKRGHVSDAVLDNIFVLFIFAGVACLALNMLLKPANGILGNLGLYLIIIALAGILLTNGRKAKGIMGKLAGGFAGIYNLINLFADVISYARIFGLTLASAAIGLAFNLLGTMFFGIPIIGYIIGGILLVILHAFNLALGLLSTYVHNIRLQYLEYYGKFYEGGGRLFSPMGEKTKYVRFRGNAG